MTCAIEDLPTRIAQKIKVDPVTGCWLWQGARTGSGYGTAKWERKMQSVHRIVYTLLVTPIPNGMEIDHVKARGCKYRHCCWPAHLEVVTTRVNQIRSDSVSGINARKERCKHGHEFTPENTFVDNRGWRRCRTCETAGQRRRKGYTGLGNPWTQNAAKTHCRHGHEFTPENTGRTPDGYRYCRNCARMRALAAYHRKRITPASTV